MTPRCLPQVRLNAYACIVVDAHVPASMHDESWLRHVLYVSMCTQCLLHACIRACVARSHVFAYACMVHAGVYGTTPASLRARSCEAEILLP